MIAMFDSAKIEAARLDAADELAPFQDEFYRLAGQIYLDGNSLGLLSRPSETALLSALEIWKTLQIEGWSTGEAPWFYMAETLGSRMASLVGAAADEVVAANSTTVNLHQLAATLFHPENGRKKILADALAFPSDLYALKSHLILRGLDPKEHLILAPSRDGLTLDEDTIVGEMNDQIGLVVLPSVLYLSGQLLDMAYLTERAHQDGLLIGFDCSHSVGVIPHEFDRWGVDFAFWCGYKYLNGGPGAAGGLYLNRRHFGRAPGLAGWFSARKDRQFDMAPELFPAPDAGSLQVGTPNILSMAPLLGALDQIERAGIDRIRRKSLAMTTFMMDLVENTLTEYGAMVISPWETTRRGGHVALTHPEASRIVKVLRTAGIIPDHRSPDILRLTPSSLYTTFAECLQVVIILQGILEGRSYDRVAPGRDLVP